MNDTIIFILARFFHVVAGVIWAGAIVFIGWFLSPATRATGSAGGAVMQQLMKAQRLTSYLVTLMLFTVLSGFLLYWFDVRAFGAAWVHTGPGRTFAAGAIFAILTVIVGLSVSAPAAKKIGALATSIQAAGKQPSTEEAAEMGRLQKRLAVAGTLGLVLILLAVTCMAVARYVP